MKAQTMRSARRYHYYLGVFFAPAIILFSLSGALQTFRLQEAKGYGGTPPAWISWVAAFHMDQAPPKPKPAPKAAPAAPKASAPAPAPAKKHYTLPLKIFVTLMAIGLILSAVTGVVIALNTRATRNASIVMLAAGTILPLTMLLLL
ncbi:hypothetical protein P1X14_20635 [Sphingomonas sp. AOB5]|uniref:hypothetical protein n=1 Tax=Sphingomonas sp. AOB5 TaxID=3034017 RepID=UPI0023F795B2|nr:hypothetical protein [Sphingomonas sp. AOB5]MDF7777674.1 hypothetical protein [Sphingomonas sp. AOB5]